MKCPYCGSGNTKVVDKRASQDANRRRRECLDCSKRFTTYEQVGLPRIPEWIKKRDGKVVKFDKEKINNAIFKAFKAVGREDRRTAEKITEDVLKEIQRVCINKIPEVEQVQDMVERALIANDHADVAKAYILYREQQAKIRKTRDLFLDINQTINNYLEKQRWDVNENANESYSFSGLLLYTSGEVIRNYSLNEIYTPAIRDAYEKGYIHIHDLVNGFVGYCAGWSLKNMLLWGFGGVPNKVDSKPAKHMDVVVHQMVNYIGCLQMEFAGAQAFNSVDTLLAPFVRTDKLNYKQVKQAMQTLVFSLNVPSRWGSQYPFSNLTFDWNVPEDMKHERAIVGGKEQDFTYGDCQKEMDMINKAFLEVMMEGDALGRVFTFPIPTYNLIKDFDFDSENAKLLFEMTAKYGIPYFQNYIGSDLEPSAIRAMCCRLNINLKELTKRPGHIFAAGDNTGSIGVVTINLNRLGYESKTKQEFFEKLKKHMILAKDSLEMKRKVIQKNLDNGLMPYAKRYLGHWNNHFSTIGVCGMNEACLNFLGKSIKSKQGKEFAIETLRFMSEVLKEFQEETGHLYNLEATPAEGTSYRFGLLDKQTYPDIITAGKNIPYLTNSTHIAVDEADDLLESLEHQNDIQHLYTGGTIFHVFLGERLPNGEACKNLVKKITHKTKIPYFTITPTFSVCKDHGYMAGEKHKCPECNAECEVFSRVVGYFRPIKQWNPGKQEEFKQRVTYKLT